MGFPLSAYIKELELFTSFLLENFTKTIISSIVSSLEMHVRVPHRYLAKLEKVLTALGP